VLDSIH